MSYISELLRRQVEERANFACEYCLLPNSVSFYVHEVDHVVAIKHGGQTTDTNLAYACWRCNRHKGSDLGSFDPETGLFAFFFNPRLQAWDDHFSIDRNLIVGLTPEGRSTVQIFQLNTNERIAERQRAASLK